LSDVPSARDFVADAYAHSKFVAYNDAAKPLLAKVIGAEKFDDGFIEIKGTKDITRFVEECRNLRFWERG
jgi:catalase